MLIRSVRLQNIKSYEALEVRFSAGVNAVTGHNGAGKSTLLEAIGYALFSVKEGSTFAREGSAGGKVSVVFCSKVDGRDYVVDRAVGHSSWLVSDCESNVVLARGAENVPAFIRHHLRMDPAVNLARLFEDAVGVPQGTLTAAFAMTPVQRKGVFDALLQVEEYRDAYKALAEPKGFLADAEKELGEEIAGLRGMVSALPAVQRAAAELAHDISEKSSLIEIRQKALDGARAELARHAAHKQAADAAARALSAAQVARAAAQAKLEQAQLDLAQARAAAQQLREHLPGHDRHVAALDQRIRLDAEHRARQALLAQQAHAAQQAAAAQARADGFETQLQGVAAAEARAAALKAPAERQAALKQQLDDANVQQAELKGAQSLLDTLTAQHAAQVKRRLILEAQAQRSLEISAELAEIDETLVDLDRVIDERGQAMAVARAAGEAIKQHTEQLGGVQEALCPICRQPISAHLRETLQQEDAVRLAAFRTQWRDADSEYKAATARRTEMQARRAALANDMRSLATPSQIELCVGEVVELERQRDRAARTVERLVDAPARVAQVSAELAALGDPTGERAVALAQARNRPELERALAAARSEAAASTATRAELDEKLAAFANLDAQLAAVEAELAATREAHGIVLAQRAAAERLPAAEVEEQRQRAAAADAQAVLAEAETAAAQAGATYSADAHAQTQAAHDGLLAAVSSLSAQLALHKVEQQKTAAEIERLLAATAKLAAAEAELAQLQARSRALEKMRKVINEAGPRITALRIRRISALAAEIYADLTGDYASRLQWDEEYELSLEVDGRSRAFKSLSGGEQMVAALAVRLALLREMSGIRVAFFDEPTANLDPLRRERLAAQIASIQGFEQIIVISHDDTFESATSNVIRLEKRNGTTALLD